MNPNDKSNGNDGDQQDPDFMGGPSFHPAAQQRNEPIRSRRIVPPSIAISTNAVNDEPEVLFDGTEALNADLYRKTAATDAAPARARRVN